MESQESQIDHNPDGVNDGNAFQCEVGVIDMLAMLSSLQMLVNHCLFSQLSSQIPIGM